MFAAVASVLAILLLRYRALYHSARMPGKARPAPVGNPSQLDCACAWEERQGAARETTETVERLRLEERFRKLTSQVPGGLFQLVRSCDGAFSIPYANAGFRNMFGLGERTDSVDSRIIACNLRKADRKRLVAALRQSESSLKPLTIEFRASTAQNPESWLQVSARPERDGPSVIWHGYISDISERKKHQLKIEDLAYFDPLTHLPNRRLLVDRLSNAIKNRYRSSMFGALLFIDLDKFKSLNDAHGHDVGDQLLVKISRRVSKCVRANDLVARIGGDEFVVFLDCIGEERDPATARSLEIANAIVRELESPFRLGAIQHIASASVGVVVFDGTETRIEKLLKQSDTAMYEAKRNGRNGVALFDPPAMERETHRREQLESLRLAMRGEELRLHYQPQVDGNGGITGAEALLRWEHPDKGLIAPGDFMPIAAASGLMGEIDDKVLATAFRTLRLWQSNGRTRHLTLAINISARSFARAEFATKLETLIREHDIDASALTLELTEHVFMEDAGRICDHMDRLKTRGLRFALDDFGTGFSSLSRLKKIPFDEVKIDGSFLADIGNQEKDRALLKTMLAMADTFGLDVVAEHVETAEQERFLRAHGCARFQGFLYGAAMPKDVFFEHLRASSVHPDRTVQERKHA